MESRSRPIRPTVAAAARKRKNLQRRGDFSPRRFSLHYSLSVPLSESHLAILTAAIDRIVPADDWPSASQAGVVEFLRRLIAAEGLHGTYARGLDDIEKTAHRCFADSFTHLPGDRQDEVLARCESEGTFFALFANQTIEGYYANPENGGNREGIAWEMVGFQVTA